VRWIPEALEVSGLTHRQSNSVPETLASPVVAFSIRLRPANRHKTTARVPTVLALHGADRTRNIAVAGIHEALQGGSKVEQECIAACRRQWLGRIKDGAELGVGKRDRRHAAGPRGGCLGIRDLAPLSKTLARNRKP
jgi:hypothetical protein